MAQLLLFPVCPNALDEKEDACRKGMTTSQSNEFLRNANGGERLKRWSGNYDSTREHLNFEIKKGGVICEVDKKTSVPKRIRMLLEERKIWD